MYPDYPQLTDSKQILYGGEKVLSAISGKTVALSPFEGVRKDFVIVHELKWEDYLNIYQHYLNNKSEYFQFLYHGDGKYYQVTYAGPPVYTWISGNYVRVEVNLIGEGPSNE